MNVKQICFGGWRIEIQALSNARSCPHLGWHTTKHTWKTHCSLWFLLYIWWSSPAPLSHRDNSYTHTPTNKDQTQIAHSLSHIYINTHTELCLLPLLSIDSKICTCLLWSHLNSVRWIEKASIWAWQSFSEAQVLSTILHTSQRRSLWKSMTFHSFKFNFISWQSESLITGIAWIIKMAPLISKHCHEKSVLLFC